MLNTSILWRICEIAERIYVQNAIMQNVFLVEMTCSILAICATFLLLLSFILNKTLHFNVRILFICFCATLMIANIGTLLDSVYYLIAIFFKKGAERCAWLSFTKLDCIALRNVYYVGTTLSVISTLFLSIERVIAALLYRTYEHNTRPSIGIFMAFLQWLLIIPMLYYQDHDKGYIFPYCAYELYNPQIMTNIQFVLLVIQFCSFIIIVVLWTHNNKKFLRKKFHSQNENVSVRYQLRENISIIKSMLPIVFMMTIIVLSATLLYVMMLPSRNANDSRAITEQLFVYCLYAEIQACFVPVMAIILIIVLPYTSQVIRRSLFQLLGLEKCIIVRKKNSVDTSPEEFICQAYFDQLQRQWSDLPTPWKYATDYKCSELGVSEDIKCSKNQNMD